MSQVLKVAHELYKRRTGRNDFAKQYLREVVPFLIEAEEQITAKLNTTLDEVLSVPTPTQHKPTRLSDAARADDRLLHGRSPRNIRRTLARRR